MGRNRPAMSIDRDGVEAAGAGSGGTASRGPGAGPGGDRNGIELESCGDVAKGAVGLMQLIPTTAQRFGANDAFNPKQNVDAGVRYLKTLLERYNGNLDLALAATMREKEQWTGPTAFRLIGKRGITCRRCRMRITGRARVVLTARIRERIPFIASGRQRAHYFHQRL